jgi:hypothetical protein
VRTVKFGFKNERAEPLDVYVEPWPEQFRLRPGELLEFCYEGSPEQEWIEVQAHEEGVTLWTNIGDNPEFLIDGKPANGRSWKG